MTHGHIRHVDTDALGAVLSSLALRGICFNVTPEAGGTWNIEITGA